MPADSSGPQRAASLLSVGSSMLPSGSDDRPSLPVYVRRADISESLEAYERLLNASKNYTAAMLAMSKASTEMASALEDCSRLKGVHASGAAFQAAGGLHYLKSNYEQLLCDTFWKEFSIPLLSQLDTYRTTVRDRQRAHEASMAEHSQLLKEIEAKYQKEGRQRRRDLDSFRAMLHELQHKVQEIEALKMQHYADVLYTEEQTWDFVAQKVMRLVRAQTDIADRLSSKATLDPVLETYMAAIPDPFMSYGPEKRGDELFTILQPAEHDGALLASHDEQDADVTVTRPLRQADRDSLFPPADHDSDSTLPGEGDDDSRVWQTQPTYKSLFGYDSEPKSEDE